jgi:hypothetical protein
MEQNRVEVPRNKLIILWPSDSQEKHQILMLEKSSSLTNGAGKARHPQVED